jgi:NADH:ubiquinone oxidoreductase subunit B-like Fe-S oxidoreductase
VQTRLPSSGLLLRYIVDCLYSSLTQIRVKCVNQTRSITVQKYVNANHTVCLMNFIYHGSKSISSFSRHYSLWWKCLSGDCCRKVSTVQSRSFDSRLFKVLFRPSRFALVEIICVLNTQFS